MELSKSTHLTLQSVLHFLVAYKLIVFHPLHLKIKNGIEYVVLKIARSSLLCIINPLVLILQLQGSSNGFLNQNPLH